MSEFAYHIERLVLQNLVTNYDSITPIFPKAICLIVTDLGLYSTKNAV